MALEPRRLQVRSGVMVPPGDACALADGLAEIVTSPSRWPKRQRRPSASSASSRSS